MRHTMFNFTMQHRNFNRVQNHANQTVQFITWILNKGLAPSSKVLKQFYIYQFQYNIKHSSMGKYGNCLIYLNEQLKYIVVNLQIVGPRFFFANTSKAEE